MATFPADILLQVKTKGVGEQLKSVENFLNRIDNRAKVVEQRLEKLRNPKGFRVAINDKAFDRVVEKSRKLNSLVDRTNNLLAQRTARLNKENTLTNSLVALERKRRDLVRERLRDEAQFRGETQYSRAIGPEPSRGQPPQGGRGGQGGIGAAIGFPLLFGGGIGSIAGGVIGSVLDDFNGAILGSGIGSTIDRFIDQTVQLSTAFDTASDSTAALEGLIGRLDNETRTRIRNLAQSGQAAKAASAAFDELAKNIGEDNARALVRAGQDFEAVGIAFQKTAAIVGAAIANIFQEGLFLNLRDPLSGIPELTPEAQRRVQRSEVDLGRSQLEGAVARAQTPDIEAQRRKELADLKARQDIREVELDFEEGLLNLATRNNKIREIANDLETEKLAIEEQRVDANQQILDAKQRAVDASAKEDEKLAKISARESERAARDLERAEQKRLQALSKIDALQIKNLEIAFKLTELEQGSAAAINQQLFNIKTKLQYQQNIVLRSQEEENVKQAQLELLQKEFELEQKILQAQAQKIQQERALTALRNTQNSERITADLGRELEDAQRLPSAFDFDNEVLDQRIRQTRRLEDITRQYTDAIEEQRAIIRNPVDADQRDAAMRQVEALERDLAAYQKLLPAINAAEQAQLKFNQVLEAATPFANAFATGLTSGLQEVVAGTKTAEEAFADFLNNIADLLVQTAAQMIAQYIAIGIASRFAGINTGAVNIAGATSIGSIAGTGIPAREKGGPVIGGQPYLVGEKGPELFTPGQSGFITPNNALGGGGNTVVNITVNTTGGSTTSSQGERAKEAAALGRLVESSVVSIINREKRPGGSLSR